MIIFYITVLVITAYSVLLYYNKKINSLQKKDNILVSLYELLPLMVALMLTTFLSNVNSLIIFGFALLSALVLLLFRFKAKDYDDPDEDLKIESLKNSYLLINITFLPFVLSMASLRFQPFYIQIPTSVLTAFAIFYLSKHVQKQFVKWEEIVTRKMNFAGSRLFIYIWGLIMVIAVMVSIFDFPEEKLENTLNLEHSTPVVSMFNDYTNDLNANYDTELVTTSISSPVSNIHEFQYSSSNIEPRSTESLVNPDSINVFRDEENNITYEAYIDNFFNTVYMKYNPDGSVEKYELHGRHNINGYVIDGVVYLTSKNRTKIEIMDGEFKINNIVNVYPKSKFLSINQYRNSSINYGLIDGEIQFVIDDVLNNEHYYSVYKVVHRETQLDLPFYAHFSTYHLVLLSIILFIPITNYKKHITVIDYEHKLNEYNNQK